jgi:hypothetical protein
MYNRAILTISGTQVHMKTDTALMQAIFLSSFSSCCLVLEMIRWNGSSQAYSLITYKKMVLIFKLVDGLNECNYTP